MTKTRKIIGIIFFSLAILSAGALVVIAGSADDEFARQASRLAPVILYFSLGCIAAISRRMAFRGLCALIAHAAVFLLTIYPVLVFCFVVLFSPLWFFLFYEKKQNKKKGDLH